MKAKSIIILGAAVLAIRGPAVGELDEFVLTPSVGDSVAIDGEYIVAGASSAGSTWHGAAYVFKHDGASWVEQARLVASDPQWNDRLGFSVSISADVVVAGAPHFDTYGVYMGRACIFARNGTEWAEDGCIEGPRGFFGDSVCIDEDVILVGAPGVDDAFVWRYQDGSLSGGVLLAQTEWDIGSEFGDAVSVSGDRIVVGAPRDDYAGENSGAAYVFSPLKESPLIWFADVKLTASDADEDDRFGQSVAIRAFFVFV
ncbi:MAG: FG-GAP repeat protein [Planctomycetota bacterium]